MFLKYHGPTAKAVGFLFSTLTLPLHKMEVNHYRKEDVMAKGRLVVWVTASNGGIPIEGALVTVYNADTAGEAVVVRSTDIDGRTEIFELDAPPRELSETPENGGVRPYSIYNVDVRKDGYFDVSNQEVPIFDGILAVLPVNMIPLSEGDSSELEPQSGINIETTEPELESGGEA